MEKAKISNRVLVAAARSLVGLKFTHMGRSIENGLDCIGIVLKAFELNGIQLDSGWVYPASPDQDLLSVVLASLGEPRPTGVIKPGDVALFYFSGIHKIPTHIAVVTDYGLIHADSGESGKVIEVRFSPGYHRHLHSVWKSPHLQYEDGFDLWQ